MARCEIAARIGVEGVADTPSIAGTKSTGDLAVGGDIACGDLLDERIDLGEKIHS